MSSKTEQEKPKAAQEGPQRVPTTLQESPKRATEGLESVPKVLPKSPKPARTPKTAKEGPGTAQNAVSPPFLPPSAPSAPPIPCSLPVPRSWTGAIATVSCFVVCQHPRA